jgi:hypothetical protein
MSAEMRDKERKKRIEVGPRGNKKHTWAVDWRSVTVWISTRTEIFSSEFLVSQATKYNLTLHFHTLQHYGTKHEVCISCKWKHSCSNVRRHGCKRTCEGIMLVVSFLPRICSAEILRVSSLGHTSRSKQNFTGCKKRVHQIISENCRKK